MLDDPTLAGDEARARAEAYNRDLESGFASAHDRARAEFQRIYDDDPKARPKSIGALFRFFRTHDDAIFDFARRQYKHITRTELSRKW